MAYQQWATGGLTVEGQKTTFDRRLLSRFRANIILSNMGVQRGIPKNGGKAISFRRQEAVLGASYAAAYQSGGAFASGPAVLTEGTPGAAMDATWTEIVASVAQYGGWIAYTDMAEMQSIDQIVPETVENFGEAMAEAAELLTRDVLSAGTNIQYAGTATSRATVGSGMFLLLKELRAAKRTLLRNNAHPVKAEGNKFVLYTHPDCIFDLEGDSNITNIWQYAGDRGIDKNQLFDVAFQDLPFGIRVYQSSLCRVFASLGLSGADVYGNLLFGEEWFGTIDLDALPARVYTKDFGSAGTADPLNQLATVGYKFSWASVILNQNNGIRIETESSNKP